MTGPLVLPLITRVGLPPPPVFIVWIRCEGSNVSTFIPLSPFSKDPWLNYGYIHGGVLIPSMVAGHWSPSSRYCSRCATHLAVTPFELLTLVLVHLPLLPFQSLWTWRGDDFCTVISFVITDTLYLVWLGSRREIHWWGNQCALPISWSHKWEQRICGRPVFLSTSISKMCGLTGLQRCYSSWENG